MRFLWWLGYAGLIVFVIFVAARIFAVVADAHGDQYAWNGFMFLCIVWLMIRVEDKRSRK